MHPIDVGLAMYRMPQERLAGQVLLATPMGSGPEVVQGPS